MVTSRAAGRDPRTHNAPRSDPHSRFRKPAGPDLQCAAAAAAQRQLRSAPNNLIDAARAACPIGCRAAARVGRPALAAATTGRRCAAGASGRRTRLLRPSRLESPGRSGVPPTESGRGVERLEPRRGTSERPGARRWPEANPTPRCDRSDGPHAWRTIDVLGPRTRARADCPNCPPPALRASTSRLLAVGSSRFTPQDSSGR